MKRTASSLLSIASLALLLSACGNSANTTTNSTTTTANKSNTAVVTNANQPATNTTTSNTTPTPAAGGETEKIDGELQAGKTESVILYVGKESGDYAGYCFTNDSEAGRAIMAACKNGDNCEVTGTIAEGPCKVPGLEADLSASGKITKVQSAKSLGRAKK